MQQEDRSNRKLRKGSVISNKMKNTVVVKVIQTMKHPRYGKTVHRAKKYYAHHEGAPLEIGEQVTIMETRPLSKLKRWRVVTV